MSRRILAVASLALAAFTNAVQADPLSKRFDVDFYRDVPSRNLKGLAARSDGRLVSGPTLTTLKGDLPADLLWTLEAAEAGTWLVGTGPDGRILEIRPDADGTSFTTRILAGLPETQVLALKRLPDGRILAGTSPLGRLYLLSATGETISQVTLPADSILDLAVSADGKTAFAGTGNPGRLYRIDVAAFAAAGLNPERLPDDALAAKGAAMVTEIRDRNVRRVVIAGPRLVIGSAPRGNVYSLSNDARPGESPVILQENRDAEVTDLLPAPNGDVHATIVFAGSTTEGRVNRPPTAAPTPADPAAPERFGGRSSLVHFPLGGLPETLAARNGLAFYRLARRGDLLLLAGGEQGDLVGYSLTERRSMNFAGSDASQINGLVPLDAAGSAFLIAGNNAAQLARLDFKPAGGMRWAETRRLDLGGATRLGALRFNRLRDVGPAQISVSLRTSQGSDEVEGWTPWAAASAADDAWQAVVAPGRYARVKVEISGGPDTLQLDRASLFHLPQNRRPQLQDFRILSANYALIPRAETPPPTNVTLGQLLGINRSESASTPNTEDRRPNAVLASQIVPQTGSQIVYWNVNDPDSDALAATFSLRREDADQWTDLVVGTKDSYVQFDISHLQDGIYFTRLVVAEQAPRPEAERQTATFETDDLVIDKTPPEILEATARRAGGRIVVTIRGRDATSLLAGVEFVFNNGHKATVEQPADGILDGRAETFILEAGEAETANATSVEAVLYDARGNTTGRRIGF